MDKTILFIIFAIFGFVCFFSYYEKEHTVLVYSIQLSEGNLTITNHILGTEDEYVAGNLTESNCPNNMICWAIPISENQSETFSLALEELNKK